MYKCVKNWDININDTECIATLDNINELYIILHKDMCETIHEQYGHCIHYMDFGEFETFMYETKKDDNLIEEYNKFMDRRVRVYYRNYIRYEIIKF